MSQLHIDQIVTLSLLVTDVAGNIVNTPFDSAPVWAPSSDPTAAVGVPSADGLTDVVTPAGNAVGKVATFSVSAIIGGTTFTASVDESIVAGAAAAVKIVETFSPKA